MTVDSKEKPKKENKVLISNACKLSPKEKEKAFEKLKKIKMIPVQIPGLDIEGAEIFEDWL